MEEEVDVSVDVDEELEGDALVELMVSVEELAEELEVNLVEEDEDDEEAELLSDTEVPDAEATESDSVTLPEPDAAAASASQYHGFRVDDAVAVVVVVVVALVLSGKPTSPAICSAKAAAMSWGDCRRSRSCASRVPGAAAACPNPRARLCAGAAA